MGCHPCYLDDFFYFYSLQVGAMVVSFAGITLLCTSIIVNLVGNDWESGLFAMAIHVAVILLFLLISFFPYAFGVASAFKVNQNFALAAALVQSFQFLIWLCLTLVSFSDYQAVNRFICAGNRCADRFFIQEAHWRSYWLTNKGSPDSSDSSILKKFLETFAANKHDTDFILSLVFSVTVAIFYVYTIMIFASYRNQIKRELEESTSYIFSSSQWAESV